MRLGLGARPLNSGVRAHKDTMSLGFLGPAVFLVALAMAVTFGYAFVWPGGVSRISLFLIVTFALAIAAAVIAFGWTFWPLKDVALAGGIRKGSAGPDPLDVLLRHRLLLAAGALILVQTVACRAVSALISR
jgi:hypothetical protein